MVKMQNQSKIATQCRALHDTTKNSFNYNVILVDDRVNVVLPDSISFVVIAALVVEIFNGESSDVS